MIREDDIVIVGKFQKTHALKGELNMISEIDPAYYSEGNPVIIENDGIFVPYYIESIRPKGSTSYLVKIQGVESELEASQFVNKNVYILQEDAKEWLNEEFNDESLIGYTIIDEDTKNVLGQVNDIEDSTVNVLLIVKSNEGDDIYIPLNEEFIVSIDDNNREIHMRLPEGLIDINQ